MLKLFITLFFTTCCASVEFTCINYFILKIAKNPPMNYFWIPAKENWIDLVFFYILIKTWVLYMIAFKINLCRFDFKKAFDFLVHIHILPITTIHFKNGGLNGGFRAAVYFCRAVLAEFSAFSRKQPSFTLLRMKIFCSLGQK